MTDVIDIEALTAPIDPDHPCGTDPRDDSGFDSPYQQLRDAREEAMGVERGDKSPQADAGPGGFTSDTAKWRVVVALATDILQTSAKDLEVCALLVEGLARTDGPAGIRDGFIVARRLIDNYWEELHPRLDPSDPDSLEDRVAGFAGLNGSNQQGPLAKYIVQMPVTEGGPEAEFRCHQFGRVLDASRNPDPSVRQEHYNSLGYSLEAIEKAAANSPGMFYVTMDQSLRECLQALRELDESFMTVCGHTAPPSSMIFQSLETLGDAIAYLGKDKIAAHLAALETHESDDTATAPPGAADDAAVRAAAPGGNGPVANREQAVASLRRVARYFRESEPHSPVSYALENVIRWAGLPLDRLLDEWIEDDQARSRYMLMTGMLSAGDNGADNSEG
jgi:type VI secretion system protein ImpA